MIPSQDPFSHQSPSVPYQETRRDSSAADELASALQVPSSYAGEDRIGRPGLLRALPLRDVSALNASPVETPAAGARIPSSLGSVEPLPQSASGTPPRRGTLQGLQMRRNQQVQTSPHLLTQLVQEILRGRADQSFDQEVRLARRVSPWATARSASSLGSLILSRSVQEGAQQQRAREETPPNFVAIRQRTPHHLRITRSAPLLSFHPAPPSSPSTDRSASQHLLPRSQTKAGRSSV